MHKYFFLLLLIFSYFSVSSMEDELNGAKAVNSKYGLVRYANVALPTEDDINSYENLYGKLPEEMKKFYLRFGNCSKERLDIHHIYGGDNSDLSNATKFIRKHLNNYHAFAFDQAAGGCWVYRTQSYPSIELFNTSLLGLTGESLNGLLPLLKK